MLITFSGLDGAGKSTLIDWLRAEVARRRPVTVLHMNDHVGVYASVRALRDWILRRPPDAGPVFPPGSEAGARGLARLRNAVLWSDTVRRLLYPLDLVIFLCYRLYYEKLRRCVMIMDRYFYDRLVDVANGRGWRWLRFLVRLTPTPHVAILLDITPAESHARKGEYTIPYLARRWEAYRTIFPWVRSGVVLPNTDLAATKRALARLVLERLSR